MSPSMITFLLGCESVSVEFKSTRQEHRVSLYLYLQFGSYFLSATLGSPAEIKDENSNIYWEISPYLF